MRPPVKPNAISRRDVQARKHRAALSSVAASGVLALAKLVAGLLSGSLALLSEAAHGAVDTGATLVTFLAVRESGKPADEDHHYGHDKFEALAALVEVFLLLAVAIVVVFEAVRRLLAGHTSVELSIWVFGALILSIVVDLIRWRALHRIAKETGSDALAADAVHFSSDLAASLIVLAGLLAYAAGWKQADTAASLGVAGFIIFAAWRLAGQTVGTLLDQAPAGLAPQLAEVARNVPGVSDVVDIRLRRLGSGRIAGEMAIGVPRTFALEHTLAVRQDVTAALREIDPKLDISIAAVPHALDDETILERVLLVAARRRLAIHHVTIQRIGEQKSISFDLEVDGALTHGQAHEMATSLEEAVRAEIGTDIEVETHIEPLTPELAGQNETAERIAEITQCLASAAKRSSGVYDIHKVRARRAVEGLVVNYHCRVDPTLSVSVVHDQVDAVEQKVRAELPEIVRLVGHAEPPHSGA